jgi:hypothetical protein
VRSFMRATAPFSLLVIFRAHAVPPLSSAG